MLRAFHLPQLPALPTPSLVLRAGAPGAHPAHASDDVAAPASEPGVDDVAVTAPELGVDDVATLCTALRSAQDHLATLPVERVIAAVSDAAHRVRDLAGAPEGELVHAVSAFTGYSAPMTRYVLERMSADWLRAPLERLLATELGGAAAVDGFISRDDGVRSRAFPPPLSLHVFAGNVPGVNVTSMVRALLLKGAVLGKVASGEPVLAALFARELHAADREVGAAVAVTYWPGGAEALERAVLARVDAVVHYGGGSAIASLRSRAPQHVRFIDHGPRTSFAVIDAAAIAEGDDVVADDLARALATFDQQGCVSPQTAWLVGADAQGAHRFAAQLAQACAKLQQVLPRGRLTAGDAAAIRELRARTEFRAIGGAPVGLWEGDGLAWTVVLDPTGELSGGCLNRTLLLRPASSIEEVAERVRPLGGMLQTVGVAGFEGEALDRLAQLFGAAGATRIATLSTMPWPPPSWHHDGRGPLTELVRWLDVES